MKIADLKAHLAKFPDDATVIFQLWETSGYLSIAPNYQHSEPQTIEGTKEVFAVVLRADRCPANILTHPKDTDGDVMHHQLRRCHERG